MVAISEIHHPIRMRELYHGTRGFNTGYELKDALQLIRHRHPYTNVVIHVLSTHGQMTVAWDYPNLWDDYIFISDEGTTQDRARGKRHVFIPHHFLAVLPAQRNFRADQADKNIHVYTTHTQSQVEPLVHQAFRHPPTNWYVTRRAA